MTYTICGGIILPMRCYKCKAENVTNFTTITKTVRMGSVAVDVRITRCACGAVISYENVANVKELQNGQENQRRY